LLLLPERRKKYYYNHNLLAFEEIRPDRKNRVRNIMFLVIGVVLVSGLAGYFINHYLLSPEKIALTKKAGLLESELFRLSGSCDSVGYLLAGCIFQHDNLYRNILGIDSLPVTIRKAGTGGTVSNGTLLPDASLIRQVGSKVSQLNREIGIQYNSLEMLKDAAINNEKKHNTIPAIQPIANNNLLLISSYFGNRLDPFLHDMENHCGLDLVAPTGTKIYATGDGIVTLLKFSRTGYGNELVINHSFGYSTRYAHLEKILVAENQPVKRGQLIGLVGNSGKSTGPHLHYEVRYEGKPVNPVFYYSDDLTDNEFDLMTNKTN
jgi:hypothetical protein